MTDLSIKIADAITTYGPKAVYAAATKAMEGKQTTLIQMGIPCDHMGCVNAAMTAAFAQLSPVDRLLDKASIDEGRPQ